MFKLKHLLWIIMLFPFSLDGHEYTTSVRHYTIDDGLGTNHINYIFQDHKGFIWFTSELGAYRFDGYKLELFQVEKRGGGPYRFDKAIEDEQNNLWFYSPNTGKNPDQIFIQPFNSDSLISFNRFFKGRSPFLIEDISFFHAGLPNNIWIGLKNGKIYHYQDGFFEIFHAPELINYIPNRQTLPLFLKGFGEDKNGFQWIAYRNKLFKLDLRGNKIKEEDLPSSTRQFQLDDKERFLFQGLHYFLRNGENNPTKPLFDNINSNDRFFSERSDYFIEFSPKDLCLKIYHKEDGLIHIIRDFVPQEVKRAFNVSHIFFQNDQTIWVATFHSGIFKIEFNKNRFHHYLKGNSTRGIFKKSNGKYYAASYSGLFEFDLLGGKKLLHNDLNKTDYLYPFLDSPDSVWFGSHSYAAYLLDFKNNKKTLFALGNRGDGKNMDVYSVYRDKKSKQLWAGTSSGLFLFDQKANEFKLYEKLNGFDDLLLNGPSQFFETRHGILLLSASGVFILNPEKGIEKQFSTKNQTLPFNNFVHIHQDKTDSTYWLASRNGGLVHWNLDSGSFEHFTSKDGLSNEVIYAVLEDEYGFLWLPGNKGLMRFNKNTHEVRTFTKVDGIADDEFNSFSSLQDEEGRIFLGGINGITVFYPKDFVEYNESGENCHLYLTRVDVMNPQSLRLERRSENYDKNTPIIIKPSEKSFRLEFALLDYHNPDKNTFEYKIEGFENNWNAIQENYVRINGLPYGNYTIYIRGRNANGFWSENQLKIPILVEKPIYLKFWFLLMVGFLGVFSLWALFKFRTNSLKRDREKLREEVQKRTLKIEEDKKLIEEQVLRLKKIDDLKNQFFTNVSHEFRTPLTLITGPLKQLLKKGKLDKKTTQTLELVEENSHQLEKLVEELLDISRLEAQKIKLNEQPVNLFQLINKLYQGFEIKAQNRAINYVLDFQLDQSVLLLLDFEKFERIIINLLSNAFKFTGVGESVSIIVSELPDKIQIQVKDTGQGIQEQDLAQIFNRYYQGVQDKASSHGGLGIGLTLSKELAILMNGSLSAISTWNEGSTFTFTFPHKEVEEILEVDEQVSLTKETLLNSDAKTERIYLEGERSILIVEDHPQMQSFLKALLPEGIHVLSAWNGKQALELLEEKGENIHLIISDLMMPEMDGVTFLRILKKNSKWTRIPVFVLTAKSSLEAKLEVLRIGVDDYLSKPFEPEEFQAILNNLLSKQSLFQSDATSKKSEPGLSNKVEKSANYKWLKELEQIAWENVTNPQFGVPFLAKKMKLSERQFHRRVKELTQLSPGTYIREIRLQKARSLLENKSYSTIAEVANEVGFYTMDYFSNLFKKRFGKLPSIFIDEHNKGNRRHE